MSVSVTVHLTDEFETSLNDCLASVAGEKASFVGVKIKPKPYGSHVTVLCDTADQAESIACEFMRAAKMIREYRAKTDAENLAKWAAPSA